MSGTLTTAAPTQAVAVAGLAAGLQALAESVRTACTDPGDAIPLLLQLAAYQPATQLGGDTIGLALAAVEAAVSAACRRAALTSLARAAAAYQPSSYDDAAALRDRMTAAIDVEIAIAGDTRDYTSYKAMRALRTAVVADLTARGGSLARVVTVTRPTPQPALVVAYDLYDDASRYDDLVRRVDPVSPLFLPTSIRVLAS